MNTCKTCGWWIEHSEAYRSHHYHHVCTNPNVGNGDDDDNGLSDNADWDYGISTGPNFGCVLWKPDTEPLFRRIVRNGQGYNLVDGKIEE